MNTQKNIIEQARQWGAECRKEGIDSAEKDPYMTSLIRERTVGVKGEGPTLNQILKAWNQGWHGEG